MACDEAELSPAEYKQKMKMMQQAMAAVRDAVLSRCIYCRGQWFLCPFSLPLTESLTPMGGSKRS
jgi:hypothetical protein